MATIVLSAAGMALGGSVGGSVLGLSMATLGRAAGATLGRSIDQRLMGGGSDVVETGRVDRLRLTGASEGAAMSQIYGRMRVAGQVIWASRFIEDVTRSGGGKGAPSRPKVTQYSYSVSLAIALCEGEITRVGRVWADGDEIAVGDLNMRVYHGTQNQMPDPKIEAVEGADQVPAYRGTAYVVLEDLDLGQFGTRVPQFTFEVQRGAQSDAPEQSDLSSLVQGVALIPGTGEYGLATTPVTLKEGFGKTRSANVNSSSGQTDYLTSVNQLQEELPQCGSVVMVVSWFGDDLRCGSCNLRPKVEQTEIDGSEMPWAVAGVGRSAAQKVPKSDGRSIYGGTPADAAVIEALQDLSARGKAAVFYPFILMEQLEGNDLIDPWSGATGQPKLPWRGRITTSLAPSVEGSPDGTGTADAQVAAFFGDVALSDFSIQNRAVVYSGPQEWSYRRFILHYAHLCAAAGGVDAFCIGSEMRSLTQIRGADGFPAVEAMIDLARDVRAVLGPDCKIGYAADWSEYHGYQPVGTADKYFHLDPLWAHPNIDFIGIDNYVPLSDWRDGPDHADAEWGAIYNLDYLKANIEGGEGYDWYYHSPEAAEAQIRTPITDGAGEPWIWRYKDMRNWWQERHHDRVNGERAALPTEWIPQSKPFWFTEIGCAAIDKGTNEPNRFLDVKSSESGLPRASNGIRDDLIQMQYIRAISEYYSDEAVNPTSTLYDGPMVDPARIHVWAWDARPYPAFPSDRALWSDGENYARGHWINGRAASRPLSAVVAEICERSGVTRYDVSELYGVVRGYGVDQAGSARGALQPLMLAYGFDAIERGGVLVFRSRGARVNAVLSGDDFVVGGEEGDIELLRQQETEIASRIRLSFIEADGDYQIRATEAVFPSQSGPTTTSASELPLVLTQGEGIQIAERWLSEARIARDGAKFALPPSRIAVGAGDVVSLPDAQGAGLYRVDRVEQTERQEIEAVRIEPTVYQRQDAAEDAVALQPFVPPVPVEALFLDLPLLRGDEDPVAPYVAATGVPWPGSVALYGSADGAGYDLNTLISRQSVVGQTLTPLKSAGAGLYDRGPALRVQLVSGRLESISAERVLSGGNLAAIGTGDPDIWEVFQFEKAELVAPDTYDISMRLRGQAGSDGIMPPEWPEGSLFVLLDGAPSQIDLASSARGVLRSYSYGPAQKPLGDPSYQSFEAAYRGNGLRPYPVAHLGKAHDGNHLDFAWIRRTREDGDAWDGADVPLGEAFERYEVKVLRDDIVIRTTTVNHPVWRYTANRQASDGVAGRMAVSVAQISERFGTGPARSIHWTV